MIKNIEEVYASMPTRKRVLDGILGFLSVPRSAAEVAEKVRQLQEHNKSVYTSTNYIAILEDAGAIERCTEEGKALDGTLQPKIVEVEGAEYYRPLGFQTVYWRATQDGSNVVAANDPLGMVRKLFDANPRYLSVYKALLEACNVDEGTATTRLSTLLDGHRLLEEPKHYTPYFIDQLDATEAIVWDGNWKLTQAGIDAIALLDTVESAKTEANA